MAIGRVGRGPLLPLNRCSMAVTPFWTAADQLLGFRSGAGLPVGGLARGRVGALARVDRQAQREPVITLTDRGVVAGQRLFGGPQFRGRVRAARRRHVPPPWRLEGLIAFLGRRFRAGHDGGRKGDRTRQDADAFA